MLAFFLIGSIDLSGTILITLHPAQQSQGLLFGGGGLWAINGSGSGIKLSSGSQGSPGSPVASFLPFHTLPWEESWTSPLGKYERKAQDTQLKFLPGPLLKLALAWLYILPAFSTRW